MSWLHFPCNQAKSVKRKAPEPVTIRRSERVAGLPAQPKYQDVRYIFLWNFIIFVFVYFKIAFCDVLFMYSIFFLMSFNQKGVSCQWYYQENKEVRRFYMSFLPMLCHNSIKKKVLKRNYQSYLLFCFIWPIINYSIL